MNGFYNPDPFFPDAEVVIPLRMNGFYNFLFDNAACLSGLSYRSE